MLSCYLPPLITNDVYLSTWTYLCPYPRGTPALPTLAGGLPLRRDYLSRSISLSIYNQSVSLSFCLSCVILQSHVSDTLSINLYASLLWISYPHSLGNFCLCPHLSSICQTLSCLSDSLSLCGTTLLADCLSLCLSMIHSCPYNVDPYEDIT